MSVVIRLMRAGAKKRPFYRVVAADSRRQRDGRFLEILGHYDPLTKPAAVKLEEARLKQWIAQGAQPSVQVASLLRSAGISTRAPKTTSGEKQAKPKAARAKGAKRAAPRKPSERKVRRRATRKAARAKKAASA